MDSAKRNILIIIIALIVIAGTVVLFLKYRPAYQAPVSENQATVPAVNPTPANEKSLGAQLFEKSQNPLENKVPTFTPEVNPIRDIYKNPFD